MKILNFLSILLLSISFSFAQDNIFNLKGWTKDVADGTMLYLHNGTGERIDSAAIQDNHFQVKGKITNSFEE